MRENSGCAISQTNEIWIRNGRRVNPGVRHRKRAGEIFVDSLLTCLISPSAVMMGPISSTHSAASTSLWPPPRITICGCAFWSIMKSASSTSRW